MIAPRLISLVLVVSMLACSGSTPPPPEAPTAGPAAAEVVAHYSASVHASYEAALAAARQMQQACEAFVAAPSAETLAAARRAWIAAREAYAPTEALRFYGGPIDDDDGPEGRLNAWPMDEAYIDYVAGKPDSGVIGQVKRYPEIRESTVVSLHERDGETNISIGFHAVEFLLWGQDLSADGPGARPYTDYVPGEGKHAERRAAYLTIAAALIPRELAQLVKDWAPGAPDNYRARFEKDPEALQKIFTGVATLVIDELSGERIAAALETRDQENEQSCFSDTTLDDHLGNARGVQAIYAGTLGGAQGPGLSALVAAADPALDAKVVAANQAAIDAIAAIGAPFDRALLDDAGRARLQGALDALDAQGRLLVEAATALGLTLDITVGEAEAAAEAEAQAPRKED